jgi:hypothetical protein
MHADPPVPPGVDPSVPSPARIYDYILGGSYNFQSDRDAADRSLAQVPERRDISSVDGRARYQPVPRSRVRTADRGKHA